MFYFGPWKSPGHYFFDERGRSVREDEVPGFPFGHYGDKVSVDGCLQPGCPLADDRLRRKRPGYDVEGLALLHSVQGWTALCFWDRSVDPRGACNSNYFAAGEFTFEQMVELAQARFAERWSRMNFPVTLAVVAR